MPGRTRISPWMTTRSVGSRPCVVFEWAGLDRLLHHHAVVLDDHHQLAGLVGADGSVGHQQLRQGGRERHAHTGERARRDRQVRVRKRGARM
jgi:hypothetical protein